MQRKQLNLGDPDALRKVELMPFQMDKIDMSHCPEKIRILSSGPIFGGTSTEPPAATPPADPPKADPPKTEPPAGGTTQTPDPNEALSKLAKDPNALQQLLSQVTTLQSDLQATKTERDKFVQEQEKAARAQMTREENLEKDLTAAHETIKQMDQVIRSTALTNAFLSQSDYQWNSIKQAMSELSDSEYQIDVDLEKQVATVSGMDKAAARIAKDFPWLLKPTGDPNGQQSNGPRSTGGPPAPPAGSSGPKADARESMMKKFPAIVHR